uniref:Uncharacterized protein n=1 Tax=Anopheles coluzzii TaxID=1518534 RepID=A0A8W7PGB8_ANOCL
MEYLYRWILRDDTFAEEVYIKYNFTKLRTLGIYKDASKTRLARRAGFYALELFFLLQLGTIVWDLATVLGDIGLFGDDMCILAGLLLTLAKKWHSVLYIDELWECVEQMQTYHEHYLLQGEWFVRRMRHQNLQERMLQDASKLLATLLASCLMVNVRIYDIFVLRIHYL